jgi:hypothetical protein
MLLKGSAGPLGEQQRQLLEKTEESCGRLSQLLAEISELEQLESGEVTYKRTPLDLAVLLAEVIMNLPELPDRTIDIDFTPSGSLAMHGDAVRLKAAFAAVLHAMRRELVGSDRLAVQLGENRLTIAEPTRLKELHRLPAERLAAFDEGRGGLGMRLVMACRVLASHGATLWSPDDGSKASAVITFDSAPAS